MPEPQEDENGDVMAGDRRLSRPDSSLPDWQIPDGHYRPIPIVWFAGALLIQVVVLPVIFMLLLSKHGLFTVVIAAAVTGATGLWTWRRGMQHASFGWRVSTILMLVTVLALVIISASPRI